MVRALDDTMLSAEPLVGLKRQGCTLWRTQVTLSAEPLVGLKPFSVTMSSPINSLSAEPLVGLKPPGSATVH